ncbi:hypothetical protein GGF46_002598 [Coemansia sp. RSA 552]|nr:hypothetical protein GGF46_002598 [Coemansia sp. RSA 552]
MISALFHGVDYLAQMVFGPLRLPGISTYWRVIVVSLGGHMLLQRLVPRASPLVLPKTYQRLSPANKKAWCVSVTVLLHSLFDSCFILAFFNDPQLNGDKMDGFNPKFEWYLAVAMGYYIWDLSLCLGDFANYGVMYLVHGGLGVFGLLILTSRQLQFYAIPYLLPELSSVFLHLRHLMKYAGLAGTLIYKINFLVFFVAFVGIRIGFEAYHSVWLVADVWAGRTGHVFYPYAVFIGILGVTLTTLNLIWLRQIITAVGYTLRPSRPTLAAPCKGLVSLDALNAANPDAGSDSYCEDFEEDGEVTGECASNAEAQPAINRGLRKYKVTARGEIVATIAWMLFETDKWKYNVNHFPGNPGQGTRTMMSWDYVSKYAEELYPDEFATAMGSGDTSGADDETKNKVRELVLSNKDSFAAGFWYLTTQAPQYHDSPSMLRDGNVDDFKDYMENGVSTTWTADREAIWKQVDAQVMAETKQEL